MQEMKSRIWDKNARMHARNVEKSGTKCKNMGRNTRKKECGMKGKKCSGMWDEMQE